MIPDLALVTHALHRSRTRAAILLELDARKISPLAPLARAVGVRPDKAHAALHGKEGVFVREASLVPLGLVRVRPYESVDRYEITEWGEQVARLLARELAAAGGRRARWARTTIAF